MAFVYVRVYYIHAHMHIYATTGVKERVKSPYSIHTTSDDMLSRIFNNSVRTRLSTLAIIRVRI